MSVLTTYCVPNTLLSGFHVLCCLILWSRRVSPQWYYDIMDQIVLCGGGKVHCPEHCKMLRASPAFTR